MKRTEKMLLCTGLISAAFAANAGAAEKNTKPNIIFILCDDMGYGDLAVMARSIFRLPIWTGWLRKVCVSHRLMPAVRSVHLRGLH